MHVPWFVIVLAAAGLLYFAGLSSWYARSCKRQRGKLESAHGELQATRNELAESARLASLGTLIAGVTHEISTPLGAIRSNRDTLHRVVDKLHDVLADGRVSEAETIEVERLTKAIAGIVEVDEMAVARISEQVRTLRTFGSGGGGEMETLDVNQALEDAVVLLRHELKNRIDVKRELGHIPAIACYPGQINQVLLNLLLNACQAIEGPGTITVRTSGGEDDVRIEIEDTGVGIATDKLERVFEPGFTTKAAGRGMGLGLPISRHIIDQHGGRIEVRSREGEGSTFVVTLPVRQHAPQPTPA